MAQKKALATPASQALDNFTTFLEGYKNAEDIYFAFQEGHYLMVEAKFEEKIIFAVDQCGLDFRQISLKTNTMADQIASRWCTTAIMLLKTLDLDTPDEVKDILEMVANQAADLSKGFKKIAEWARALAGRLETSTRTVTVEIAEFEARFQEIKDRAEKEMEKRSKEYEKARKHLEKQEHDSFWWSVFSWVPVVGWVGSAIADKHLQNAEKIEDEYQSKLQESKRKLAAAKDRNERAQIVGSKLENLINLLSDVQGVCEWMAVFWQFESDKFKSLAGTLRDASQLVRVKVAIKELIPKSLNEIEQRKVELQKYHKIMSVINGKFNFETRATPTKFPAIELPHLHISLN